MNYYISASTLALALIGADPAIAQIGRNQSTPPALASQGDVGGPASYPASYFTAYGSITAYDMVLRLPGFSFRDGGGARGFGVNAGNVLINGSRPTIKSETLEALLRRIPAASVLRIEIIDQATGSDLAGLGRVANVVLKSDATVSGTYSLATSVGENGNAAFEGRASVSLKGTNNSVTLSISHIPDVSRTVGPEFVSDPAGRLTERRIFDGVTRSTLTSLSVAASQTLGDVKLNGSAKVALPQSRTERDGVFFNNISALLGHETLFSQDPASGTNYELAGDIATKWAKGFSSKLLALFNSSTPKSSGRVERVFPSGTSSFRLTENIDAAQETVVRLSNSLLATEKFKIEFGAELARNRLDASFSDQFGSATTTSFARVRETRFEPFISGNWSPAPNLQLEAGLIAERSTLDVISTGAKKSRFLF